MSEGKEPIREIYLIVAYRSLYSRNNALSKGMYLRRILKLNFGPKSKVVLSKESSESAFGGSIATFDNGNILAACKGKMCMTYSYPSLAFLDEFPINSSFQVHTAGKYLLCCDDVITLSTQDNKLLGSIKLKAKRDFNNGGWNANCRNVRSHGNYIVFLTASSAMGLIKLPTTGTIDGYSLESNSRTFTLTCPSASLVLEDIDILNERIYCLDCTGHVLIVPFKASRLVGNGGEIINTESIVLQGWGSEGNDLEGFEKRVNVCHTALTANPNFFVSGYAFTNKDHINTVGFALYNFKNQKVVSTVDVAVGKEKDDVRKVEAIHHIKNIFHKVSKINLVIAASVIQYLFLLGVHPSSHTISLISTVSVSSWAHNAMVHIPSTQSILLANYEGISSYPIQYNL